MSKSKLLSSLISLVVVNLGLALAGFEGEAHAETIIRTGRPPQYGAEIEPHFNLQPFNDYASTIGFGFGLRVSIPVMSPGFIKTIDDSIAISFGGDLVHFGGGDSFCDRNVCVAGPSYWALYAPVAMQWNFFLTDKWSVFGEPGLVLRHGFAENCNVDGIDCSGRDSLRPAFFAGGRYKFSDGASLTLRVGYPIAASVGLSFF